MCLESSIAFGDGSTSVGCHTEPFGIQERTFSFCLELSSSCKLMNDLKGMKDCIIDFSCNRLILNDPDVESYDELKFHLILL